MSNLSNPDKWYPALRLAWIERRAQATGTICRQDIITAFGLSEAVASADLQKLQELHPGCLTYDVRAKRYRWSGKKLITKIPWPVTGLDVEK